MLGKKSKLRKDLPPVDIRTKAIMGWFGKPKTVQRTKREQRKVKIILQEKFPDRYFVDDLNDWNSITVDKLSWINDIEYFLAATED